MHQERNILEDVFYTGASDRRIRLFENVYPLHDGMSYNTYVVLDEKTVLFDTIDRSVERTFFENVEHVLAGRPLDYLIVTHMEPDHAATLQSVVEKHPEVTIVGNNKTFGLIKQFFDFDLENRMLEVKEGSVLNTGKHNFTFYTASMVHWPEVMFVYDDAYKMLYTADAFGTYGAMSGNIFADELDFPNEWLAEARRYYVNIVGKYGLQVQAAFKKISKLDVDYILPLHGPIWREKEAIAWYMDKYAHWASYTAEDDDVVIFCGSVYGNTEECAMYLAGELAKKGIKNIHLYDVSARDTSFLMAEAFRAKALVFASSSYNAGLFTNMDTLLEELKAHNFQNRNIVLIENGSWALSANKRMKEIFGQMKNITIKEETLSFKSTIKESDLVAIHSIADAIVKELEA